VLTAFFTVFFEAEAADDLEALAEALEALAEALEALAEALEALAEALEALAEVLEALAEALVVFFAVLLIFLAAFDAGFFFVAITGPFTYFVPLKSKIKTPFREQTRVKRTSSECQARR